MGATHSLPKGLRALYRDALPHFEVTILDSGEVLFVCARCRLKFSFPIGGPARPRLGHLMAHLTRHGINDPRRQKNKPAREPNPKADQAPAHPTQGRFDLALLGSNAAADGVRRRRRA